MLIGLGGGAASSVDSGTMGENLNFASVQRENPEMEHRCREVKLIHAGIWKMLTQWSQCMTWVQVVYSNAMPELVNDHELRCCT